MIRFRGHHTEIVEGDEMASAESGMNSPPKAQQQTATAHAVGSSQELLTPCRPELRRKRRPVSIDRHRAVVVLCHRIRDVIRRFVDPSSVSGGDSSVAVGGRVFRWMALLFAILVVGTLLAFVIFFLVWTFKHSQCYTREAGVEWEEGPSHDMIRPCPAVMYETLQQRQQGDGDSPHICITTLTDEKSPSWWQRSMRCRDFDKVGRLTWPIRQAYADKHGYTLVDFSSHIDSSRPPAWSKIKAVQSLLPPKDGKSSIRSPRKDSANSIDDHRSCDWIFWMDADTIIMNSSIRIESFLPKTDDTLIDLIVTMDRRFTANSGAWLLRANSTWSREFLEQWWNMESWVRPSGLSLSGDNAAFGELVNNKMKMTEKEQELEVTETKGSVSSHIQMVPRCTFNSFGVYLQAAKAKQLRKASSTQNDAWAVEEWYQSPNFYYKGDFVAHASGIDQKAAGIEMLLKRAQ